MKNTGPPAGSKMKPKSHNAPGKGDPTTSDVEYPFDDVEFMMAMDAYKRDNDKPFPRWQEVLSVVKSLGYRKDPAISKFGWQ